MTSLDPSHEPEIVRHPYSVVVPQRSGDAVIGLMALLRNDGVKCFIAGGFARWVLSTVDTTPCPGDIDIFFEDKESYEKCVWLLKKEKFTVALESQHAVTMNPPNTAEFDVGSINIQLIKPNGNRFGTIFDVLDGFDMSICQAALVITPENKLKGYVSNFFTICEAQQRVRLVKMAHPLATMRRCIKYVSKGYKVSSNVLLEIFEAWDKLPQEKRQQAYDLAKSGQFGHLYNLLGHEATSPPNTNTL